MNAHLHNRAAREGRRLPSAYSARGPANYAPTAPGWTPTKYKTNWAATQFPTKRFNIFWAMPSCAGYFCTQAISRHHPIRAMGREGVGKEMFGFPLKIWVMYNEAANSIWQRYRLGRGANRGAPLASRVFRDGARELRTAAPCVGQSNMGQIYARMLLAIIGPPKRGAVGHPRIPTWNMRI